MEGIEPRELLPILFHVSCSLAIDICFPPTLPALSVQRGDTISR